MDETRTCTECGAKMTQGYCVNGGEEYYCTDECLHKHYTPEEREEMYGDGDTDSYRTEREEERPAREQLHADCHRQEARKTPAGEVRIATINANMHPDGKIGRDAVAHRHAGNSREYRHEQRTTDDRTGTDATHEARVRRTRRMAEKHPNS